MRRILRSGPHVQVAAVILGLIILATILASLISPYSPTAQDIMSNLQAPSLHHLFGTDPLGRDVFSQVLYGGRISLSVGLIAVMIEFFFGVILGVTTGYLGGWLDAVVMRLTDIMLAMPGLVFALFIVAILGPGIVNVMIALGIGSIPSVTRITRGSTLSVCHREYVDAARASGATFWHIALRHIVPNVISPIMVLVLLDIGGFILSAAGMSFIGLGAQPPSPEWGAMLSNARNYFPSAWWLSVFPGVAIAAVVLCVNIIGDAVRDYMDPRLRAAGTAPSRTREEAAAVEEVSVAVDA